MSALVASFLLALSGCVGPTPTVQRSGPPPRPGPSTPERITAVIRGEPPTTSAEVDTTVRVYTTPTCPWCARTKELLQERGIPFQEIDVSRDRRAHEEMVRISGQSGVPVTVAGGEVIVGFNQRRLEQLADRIAPPE